MDIKPPHDGVDIIIKKRKKPRKFWMNPTLTERRLNGHFHILYENLQTNNEKCLKTLGMSVSSFNDLLRAVKPRITYSNTNMRMSVSPEERLTITLKHLCTGDSFTTLHTEFLVGVSTVSTIVYSTCSAICESIRDTCMPEPSKERWLEIADLFYKRTNFPNCLGAIVGKFLHLVKADCFIILLAIVDANYCFTAMDVIESFGDYYPTNIFHSSYLGKKFKNDQINIPPPNLLPGDSQGVFMPYVLVSDECFSKSGSILRPFSCRKVDEIKKHIFNYRSTRPIRMAESALGILTSKWKILYEKLSPNPTHACLLVKTCLILHNYVFKNEGAKFEDTLYACTLDPLGNQDSHAGNGSSVRGYFSDYFVSPSGAVSWQNSMI